MFDKPWSQLMGISSVKANHWVISQTGPETNVWQRWRDVYRRKAGDPRTPDSAGDIKIIMQIRGVVVQSVVSVVAWVEIELATSLVEAMHSTNWTISLPS